MMYNSTKKPNRYLPRVVLCQVQPLPLLHYLLIHLLRIGFSCTVLVGHRKYHPTGDDTSPALDASDP